jgi:hypothetical protein
MTLRNKKEIVDVFKNTHNLGAKIASKVKNGNFEMEEKCVVDTFQEFSEIFPLRENIWR